MTTRVAITGASGLLGRALVAAATERGFEIVAVARRPAEDLPAGVPVTSLDVLASDSAAKLWSRGALDAVVHAAALTDVDACEHHPDHARRLHVQASSWLATEAARHATRFVHVSTDAVFSGDRPSYAETDAPGPLNVYARTKHEGESTVLRAYPEALVVRTNFFGLRPGSAGRSLAEWALRELRAGREIQGFEDVRFNPLWSGHLAQLLWELALGPARGVLHVGARDAATKGEFLRRLATALHLDPRLVQPARSSDRAGRAPRPLCTVLEVGLAAAALGRALPSLDEELDAFTRWAEVPGVGAGRMEGSA